MRKLLLAGLMLPVAIMLALPGCVELTGQRITWSYDEAKDELRILIHYDGIHDSGSDQHGKGREQIPQFVKEGDVMLLDWPFQLPMQEAHATLDDDNADPREKAWAELVTSIRTEPVGYYREPDGRIGAAQLLTIPDAKKFIRRLNKLLSQEILSETVNPGSSTARTQKRIQAAAKRDHQWIELRGQTIHVSAPVHPMEWARLKANTLQDLLQDVVHDLRPEAKEREKREVKNGVQALAAAPLSYIDRGDRVVFMLGGQGTSNALRLNIRDEYESSLEDVVAAAVKVDLDEAVADTLLDENKQPGAAISAVLDWGPPEERVRALIAAASNGGDKRKEAALQRLRQLASRWNRKQGWPEAPAELESPETYLAAWKKWYGQMRQFPLVDAE